MPLSSIQPSQIETLKIRDLSLDMENSIVIFDKKLIQFQAFRSFLKKVKHKIPVSAGEKLKSLELFEIILMKVQKISFKYNLGRNFKFVGIGGGSVTDFVGFLASTYQRGHPVIFIPSTWLCAIDSAHGGKNGLNVLGVKNQLGTIYFPEEIIVCHELLKLQPEIRLLEATGEIYKILLLSAPNEFLDFKLTVQHIEKKLIHLINCKMKIVKQDPFETKSIRYLLNFGHTMGHVYESVLSIPHGIAVLYGLMFSVLWSEKKGHIDSKIRELIFSKISSDLEKTNIYKHYLKTFEMSANLIVKHLQHDKKKMGQKIKFIYLKMKNKTIIEQVDPSEIVAEWNRQKKLKGMLNVQL